jgi:hypothetical protein
MFGEQVGQRCFAGANIPFYSYEMIVHVQVRSLFEKKAK